MSVIFKYPRLFCICERSALTLNPTTFEVTNEWTYANDLLDVSCAGVDTQEFCMLDACTDATTGTDCYCLLDGSTPTNDLLPVGCMESGTLSVEVPSKRQITLLATKNDEITKAHKDGQITKRQYTAMIRHQENNHLHIYGICSQI